jgi:regulator of protease activity HflC (stomatin/prohibitin superfamily)
MEVPKFTRRRGIVFYLQIAAAVVSLILGLAQMTKESAPIVQQYQHHQQQVEQQKKQQEAQSKAAKIVAMNIQWQYRGNDETWRYYSDATNSYWCRVNIQGTYEYAENPALIASSQKKVY